MNGKKKNFLIAAIVLISFMGLLIKIIYEKVEQSSISYEEFRESFGEEAWGHQLGVVNPQYGPMGERLIWDSQTEHLIIEFDNFTADTEFRLKIFWNYEEIEFSVDDDPMENYYIFSSRYKERVELPVKLSSDTDIDLYEEGFLGFLTVNIFIEPNKFQRDIKLLDHDYVGINSVQYIFSDSSFSDYDQAKTFNTQLFEQYDDFPEEFFGLNVTTKDDEIMNIPSTDITVKKGEKIDLNFILGDGTDENIDKYLIFSVLGNDQVKINNKSLLYLKLPLDNSSGNLITQTGTFSIIAPEEVGAHELIIYAAGIPVEQSSYSNIENSFRITIVVEE